MSSDKDRRASMDKNKGSSGGKQTPPGDDTGSKSADTQNVPSAGGHEVMGAEKFDSLGGSGGVTIRGGQGYEALAQHQ